MAKKKSTTRRAPGKISSDSDPGALKSDRSRAKKATEEARKPPAQQATTSTTQTGTGGNKPAFPIVGIGASAGGLDAFKKFFAAMPPDSGMAFVLIPHLDPTHESLMVELLTRQTEMPVVEAEDGTAVEPNSVYIIPPNKYLAISGGNLQLSVPPKPRGLQTAIDFFLRSLAADQGERAIGIVLSGTGSHGTPGIREIKLAGGMVMAQETESAEYDQMPRSAIASGLVDYVLPPEQMPEALVKYVEQPYLNRLGEPVPPLEEAAEQLNRILAVLRTRTKYDFRSYRKNMLMRRIQRRMGLRHIDQFAGYLDLLRESGDEVTALYKDLLIGVTAFFRETEAFHVLEQRVIPELVERTTDERPIRVWVPGCATGEEAYSIAMLLMEGFAAADKPLNIQIFASDIDDQSLDVARTGIYPASIAGDVSLERLKRFFIKTDENHYQVNKQLRESIVFAPQNLISDAPFSRLDLISCRNLLIYLEPNVQEKVIALFHFALGEDGYLLLGPSESIGRAVDLFEPVSKKCRVYRRIGPVRRELVEIPIVATHERRGMIPRAEPASKPSMGFRELTEKLILSDFAPAAALINRKYEILYVTGPLVNYLEFPTGELTTDLLAMTRQGLRTKVRAACHQAIRESQTVTDAEARVKRHGSYVPCTITVRPITEPKEAAGLMLVTFQDRDTSPQRKQGTDDPSLARRAGEDEESKLVQQLEFELKSTREDLQSTIEEMESSNEELKASNEEVMSMNEELQSANEELETSKEELQSLNEELSTVNNQLQEKVGELDKANSDMINLTASSDIATVFLDTDLQIVRFTPPTAKLLNLMATDVGRPFRDFAPRFTNDNLLDECRMVLDKLRPLECELRTEDRRYYLRRILPYRTADNRINGVSITYVDITTRVESEAEMRRLATVTRDSNDAVTVQALDGRIIVWNRGAERMYGYSEAEALKMNVRELVPEDLRDEALAVLHRAAESKESESFDTKRVTKDGRTLDVSMTVSKLVDEAGGIVVATTERDVSDRTHEIRLLAEAISHLGEGVIITSDGLDWPGPRIVFVNEAICQITGYAKNELIGQTPRILQGDGSDREILERIKAELSAGRSCVAELVNHRKDGTPYNAELFITPLFDADGHRTNFVAIHRDISERKQAEKELRDSEAQKSAILRSLTAHIAVIDRDGTIVSVNPAWEEFARDNEGSALRCNVGANYLEVCRKATGECADEAPRVAAGLQAILDGNAEEFSLEYACHSTTEQRWFFIQATSFQSEEVGAVVSHTNITERKRAEEALRQQHELSDGIINSAQHIILLLDTEGRIVRFNPFLETLSGWRLDEVKGRDWFDIFLPEHDRERVHRLFSRAIGGERTQGNVNSIVTKDGRELEIEWHDTTLTSVAGELVGLLCTGQDITARKRAENELRRLSKVFTESANAIFIKDLTGRIVEMNAAAERTYGWTRDELIGRSIKTLVPRERHNDRDKLLQRCLQGKEVRGVEAECVTKSGEVRAVLLTLSLLTDEARQPIGIATISEDITERKRAEAALRQSEERLRAILNTAADAIINIDHQGIITDVNAATEAMFGYTQEELIGQNVKILMPPPYRDEHDDYIARYLETGEARIIGIGREVIGRRKDGSTFPIGLSVNEVDYLGLFTGIVRDVSTRKTLERDVVNIAEDEQRRIGQDLHDSTQQELAGLGMLAQTLLNNLAKESANQPKAESLDSCQLAKKILDGIARAHQELQTISRGLVPIRIGDEGLMDALRELASRTDDLEGVTCAFKCEQPVEVADSLTATHLYRIAQEAVTNALKHGPPEHILIGLESENGQPILQVADDGAGFDSTGQYEGMGLKTMRYRASLIGASLAVSPVETGGTLVTCKVFGGG